MTRSASLGLSSTRRIHFLVVIVFPGLVGGVGKVDVTRRALVGDAFGPSASAVPVDDAADIRQADTGAFKFAGAVQALEHPEELVRIAHVEPHAIVADEQDGFPLVAGGADFD